LKNITLTVLALIIAATAFAQDKTTAQKQNDPIVMAAGDIAVRQSEFEGAIATLPAEYQQYAMGPGKRQFAEDYLRLKMLAAQGKKAGLDKDPKVLRQLELMKDNLVANAQLEKMEDSIAIPEAELKSIYDSNKGEYEQVKARHILVAFKGSPAAQPGKPELTEEQAKAKAEELRKQIEAGASFEEIAKKESDDVSSGAQGGDLGEFGHGQMVKEFETAAFGAKAGEVTPVVRTQFGYHIIKVDEHTTTPFDEVKEALERTERQERLQAAIEKMKTEANPTFNDSYFAPATPAAPPAGGQQQ
jgi:peptidyl-prolyl cis-trans isomerase C